MIPVEIRSRSGTGNKAMKVTKLTFSNRDNLKDFLMSMAYNNTTCIIEIGKEYRKK